MKVVRHEQVLSNKANSAITSMDEDEADDVDDQNEFNQDSDVPDEKDFIVPDEKTVFQCASMTTTTAQNQEKYDIVETNANRISDKLVQNTPLIKSTQNLKTFQQKTL